MADKKLSGKILQVRTMLQESRREFGSRIGCTSEAVRKWELGETTPSNEFMPRLESCLAQYSRAFTAAPTTTNPPTGVPVKWTTREINALQKKAGLNLKEFAETLGVSDRGVIRWRAGKLALLRSSITSLNALYARVHAPTAKTRETPQKVLRLLGNAVRPTAVSPAKSDPDATKDTAATSIMETVQAFKDKRNATLVDDALTHVGALLGHSKPQARKLIATFLYLVYEEIPLNTLLKELTSNDT